MQEVITVPANIRTQFDTSKLNTEINTIEEALKDQQVLGDEPYIPTPDERTLNVVQRIKETSTYYKEEASAVGMTNIWELKEGVTRSYSVGDQVIYLISESLKDPSYFLGATLINSEGASYTITEIPDPSDSVYVIGNEEAVIIVCLDAGMEAGEGVLLPAGTFTSEYEGNNTTVVKIIAKSAIFPVQ